MQFAMICEPCIFMGKSILQYNDRTVNYCKMIYFHFRADHYFLDRRATFLEHIIFSHLQIVHDFLLVGKYLVEVFFNIKSHHKLKIVEKTCPIFPHGTTKFFSAFYLVQEFLYLCLGGDYPPFICSYTQEIRNFYLTENAMDQLLTHNG